MILRYTDQLSHKYGGSDHACDVIDLENVCESFHRRDLFTIEMPNT